MVARRAQEYLAHHRVLAISAVTVSEVVEGHQHKGRQHHVEEFLDRVRFLEVLPLDTQSAVVAGRIAGDLRRTGQAIGPFDPLIAAIAITYVRTLVTGNTEHYRRIIDLGYPLLLDDWRQAV